jgi:hypothetical protein
MAFGKVACAPDLGCLGAGGLAISVAAALLGQCIDAPESFSPIAGSLPDSSRTSARLSFGAAA